TTSQKEGRSTRYASDLAKGFEVPIIHVNSDDPVASVSAIKLAYEYCKTFHKDFLIDLVGYRRYGHNEMDEPRMTQPVLYEDIDQHPGTARVYAKDLEAKGIIKEDEYKEMEKEVQYSLRTIYEGMETHQPTEFEAENMPKVLTNGLDQFETAVPL